MRVAVVGGGVVGCAVTLALARRGVDVVLLEAHAALGLEASGTNSGILHTGFDSVPGELETRLIHRSTALREDVIEALGVPLLRCGAEMARAPDEVVQRARINGVPVERAPGGTLRIPGEWVTDPVAFTLALAAAAGRAGAEVRTGFRVVGADSDGLWSDDGRQELGDVVVDCAGLHAHDVAHLFGDDSFVIRPRKGEFLVFDVPLERILLPVPTSRTKGVLVFPTVHGGCIAGPTAIDQDDPDDWSVRPEAAREILAKAVAMHPALAGAQPVASYAGLRPAGVGANYVIRRSTADRRLVIVGAIRSTGLSAALGIAEHVAELIAPGMTEGPLRSGAPAPTTGPWWLRSQRERPTRSPDPEPVTRQLLLGIDEGTSGAKVVAYDLELRPVASARRAVTTVHPRPGWVEQDADEVLGAVVDAVAEVLDATDGEVVACGLDHQGESVVAWDAQTGQPLGPIIVWQDQRGAEVLARLSDPERDEVTTRSGLPPDAYFSAASLGWLMADGGLEMRPGLRLGTLDAFLSERLGAGFGTDASTASRTQLSGIVGGGSAGWDPVLLGLFGVPADALPPILDSTGDLGELHHPRWRQALPLRARVVDQQASLAGTGCVLPLRARATYGTGVFVLVHTGDAIATSAVASGLLPTVAWRIGGRTSGAVDGGVFSAGSMLEWLALGMGLAPDVPAVLDLAASVPDAGGVRILPALGGLGAPWWRPDARGVIAGLSAHSRPAHVARAALDAIAERVGDIVRAADGLVPVEDLRIDGRLTRAPGFAERQATILGRPVWRSDTDATARGAAALAAVGAGILARVEDIDDLLPAFERVDPDPAAPRPDPGARARFVGRAADLLG